MQRYSRFVKHCVKKRTVTKALHDVLSAPGLSALPHQLNFFSKQPKAVNSALVSYLYNLMFNIKKGIVSLDVTCTEASPSINLAPDDRSALGKLVHASLQTHRALAMSYLRLDSLPNREAALMKYFQGQGYRVTSFAEASLSAD